MKKVFLVAVFAWSISSFAASGLIVRFVQDPCPNNQPGKVDRTGNAAFDVLCESFDGDEMVKHREGRAGAGYFFTVQFSDDASRDNVLRQSIGNAAILYVERDQEGSAGSTAQVQPNDTYFSNQWGLYNDGTFSMSPALSGADIDMQNAWSITQGDSNVVVGTMDSGLRLGHPEFAGRLWTNTGEIPANNVDDDANGYIDDINGWDFVNNDNNPTDDHGHGTNVTGIIGANGNNATGYAGMDWNCKLMTLKGLDGTGVGLYTWWADALYYATDNGVDVINMSVGGSGASTTLQNAVNYAINNGVVIVACMMNTNSSTIYYPAAYAGVIAVGATNPNDTRANPFFWSPTSGSNYGSHLSVVAPGNYIYGLDYTSNTNYNSYWGGTSQAAPHVAGLAALLLSLNNSLTPAQIKTIIETTAEDQVGLAVEDVAGWDQYYGHGRINAYQAMLATMIQCTCEGTFSTNIYPNPSTDRVTLSVEDEIFKSGSALYTIYNAVGQSVSPATTIFSQVEHIDVSTFERGLYFIEITTADGRRVVRSFVLN